MLSMTILVWMAGGLAAFMLATAGVLAPRKTRLPEPILIFIRALYAILWASPAVFLLLLAALVLRARWILGFWPYPHRFDPSRYPMNDAYVASPLEPGSMPIHFWAAYAVFVLAALAILWAIPAYTLLRATGRRPSPAGLSVLVTGWVTIFLLSVCDPGGCVGWFFD